MTLPLQRTLFLILIALALVAMLIGTVGTVSSQISKQNHSTHHNIQSPFVTTGYKRQIPE